MAASNSYTEQNETTVSFARKLVNSDAFKTLFQEGMSLVEEAAAYLDGPGRIEAKILPRMEALAYASESMRLTTRLMQLASWLLMQRAVNDGELSMAQARSEKQKVKLSRQALASNPETYERLPLRLRELSNTSLRLQERILHLDQLLYNDAPLEAPTARPLDAQMDLLREAFGRSEKP